MLNRFNRALMKSLASGLKLSGKTFAVLLSLSLFLAENSDAVASCKETFLSRSDYSEARYQALFRVEAEDGKPQSGRETFVEKLLRSFEYALENEIRLRGSLVHTPSIKITRPAQAHSVGPTKGWKASTFPMEVDSALLWLRDHLKAKNYSSAKEVFRRFISDLAEEPNKLWPHFVAVSSQGGRTIRLYRPEDLLNHKPNLFWNTQRTHILKSFKRALKDPEVGRPYKVYLLVREGTVAEILPKKSRDFLIEIIKSDGELSERYGHLLKQESFSDFESKQILKKALLLLIDAHRKGDTADFESFFEISFDAKDLVSIRSI